mmetsp:Transcript_29832/g.65203  ORF Transcript_29832/g.65203 Transcript_29832/m.65203 type:complete len:293 (-) Transcript_29832:135-1013(-)
MRSAMVMATRPCSAANLRSSGVRDMEPSSLTISQITPTGAHPAMRLRSTAASVCPARFSTPPSRARSGNTCPGRCSVSGLVAPSASARTVIVRSAAEMPVEVFMWSQETVYAVSMRSSFSCEETIWGRSNSSQRFGSIATQTSPLVCLTMKPMASGVIRSAGMIRSPSFSLSSSSSTTTNLPAAIASKASSIVPNLWVAGETLVSAALFATTAVLKPPARRLRPPTWAQRKSFPSRVWRIETLFCVRWWTNAVFEDAGPGAARAWLRADANDASLATPTTAAPCIIRAAISI